MFLFESPRLFVGVETWHGGHAAIQRSSAVPPTDGRLNIVLLSLRLTPSALPGLLLSAPLPFTTNSPPCHCNLALSRCHLYSRIP